MKKVAFVSEMALLEPNLSIVKRLNTTYDLYYVTDCRQDIPNKFGIKNIRRGINRAIDYEEMTKFSSFFNLQKTYLIYSLTNKNFFNAIKKAYDVVRVVRKISPSVILTDTTAPYTVLLFLFYYHKIVLLVHDPFPHSGYKKKWLILFRYLAFKLIRNKVIFNTKQYEAFIRNYKLSPQDVFCSNLSTLEFMKVYRPCNKNTDGKFKILFWGIISQYKGIEYLCSAFEEIVKQGYQDIELTIAGSGELYFDIDPYLKYSNFKFIHKFLTNEEIADYVFNTDIVVCPYVDATQSGVIMTAFAYCKPVIATNVGGLSEVVDEYSGILIEPRSVKQLVDSILLLYKKPYIIKQMERYLREDYAETEKGWEHGSAIIASAIEKQYEEQL